MLKCASLYLALASLTLDVRLVAEELYLITSTTACQFAVTLRRSRCRVHDVRIVQRSLATYVRFDFLRISGSFNSADAVTPFHPGPFMVSLFMYFYDLCSMPGIDDCSTRSSAQEMYSIEAKLLSPSAQYVATTCHWPMSNDVTEHGIPKVEISRCI